MSLIKPLSLKFNKKISKLRQDKTYKGFMTVLKPLSIFLPYMLADMLVLTENPVLIFLSSLIAIGYFYYDIKHPIAKSNKSMLKKIGITFLIVLAMYFSVFLLSLFYKNGAPVSENQHLLIHDFKKQGSAMMCIALFFAPIFEESIFRRGVIRFNSKKEIIITSIISVVFFVLAHMPQTSLSQFGAAIFYLPPAIGLTAIYAMTKDIRCSMLGHFLWNCAAALVMFL